MKIAKASRTRSHVRADVPRETIAKNLSEGQGELKWTIALKFVLCEFAEGDQSEDDKSDSECRLRQARVSLGGIGGEGGEWSG